MNLEQAYHDYRPLLFSIAYRLLGTVTEAEDIVQDVFTSLGTVNWNHIQHPKAFLCQSVSNRCLNLMKASVKKKERYVGNWLPEPFIHSTDNEPLMALENKEAVSYAYLVMLETLTPTERIIFVLKTSYAIAYDELAEITGKTEVNCRKIYSRARQKMKSQPAVETCPDSKGVMVQRFIEALHNGNITDLIQLMREDTIITTDGGGKVRAATRQITSIQRIFAFFKGILAKEAFADEMILTQANGSPALMVKAEGRPKALWLLALTPDASSISHVYGVLNPDKLPKNI